MDSLPPDFTSSTPTTDGPSASPLQSHSHSDPNLPSATWAQRASSKAVPDRKFNVILFGVSESPQGTPRHTRSTQDFNSVASVFSDIEDESNLMYPIRDCQRLGKYNSSSGRPRPILVTLNSTAQVSHVLAHRHSLPSHVSVKPDRSFSERKSERILLSERWKLIQAGSDRRSIKLRNSSLYLNGRLHGKVVNGTYSLAPFLSDLAPELSDLSDVSSDSHSSPSSPNVPSS